MVYWTFWKSAQIVLLYVGQIAGVVDAAAPEDVVLEAEDNGPVYEEADNIVDVVRPIPMSILLEVPAVGLTEDKDVEKEDDDATAATGNW